MGHVHDRPEGDEVTDQEWAIFTRKAKRWLAAVLWIAAIIFGVHAEMQQARTDGGSHERSAPRRPTLA